MVSKQRKIPPSVKLALVKEAGEKCANPGCSNWRTHIHHIKHWAVYKTHEANHMIAVCPSCHDAIHFGKLPISDEVLYRWKGIVRPSEPSWAHVAVEPASDLKLLTGSVYIASKSSQFAAFRLSNFSHLTLRVLDGDIIQASTRIVDRKGNELLRVVENNVRVNRSPDVRFDFQTGHVRITVPANDRFVPDWLVPQVRHQYPDFAIDGRIVALDIEVLRPGVLRVQGYWPNGDTGIVINEHAICFCEKGLREPISIVTKAGDELATLLFNDTVTSAALFSIGKPLADGSSPRALVQMGTRWP